MAIIDRKQLFLFKTATPPPDDEKAVFGETLTSNEDSYVAGLYTTWENIWSESADAENRINLLDDEKILESSLKNIGKTMKENGWIVESPGEVKGSSGALHKFQLIAKKDKPPLLLAVCTLTRGRDATTTLMNTHIKAIDVKPKASILIGVNTRLSIYGEELTRQYGVNLVEGADEKELTEKFVQTVNNIFFV